MLEGERSFTLLTLDEIVSVLLAIDCAHACISRRRRYNYDATMHLVYTPKAF